MRIDLASGAVVDRLDASALVAEADAAAGGLGPEDVLNGIAANPDATLWLTGKRWPLVFLVAPAA